jgi:hypothetical protein
MDYVKDLLSGLNLHYEPFNSNAMKCLIESSDYNIAKQLENIALQCAMEAKTQIETKVTVRSKIQSNFITLQINVDEALGDSQSWCLACRLSCFCPAARVSIIISAQPLFQQTAPQILSQKPTCKEAAGF